MKVIYLRFIAVLCLASLAALTTPAPLDSASVTVTSSSTVVKDQSSTKADSTTTTTSPLKSSSSDKGPVVADAQQTGKEKAPSADGGNKALMTTLIVLLSLAVLALLSLLVYRWKTQRSAF
jgi:hypothetical protein